MKRIALIITLILLFIFAGYLYYDKAYKPSSGSLWDKVPANAVMVYECQNTIERWNKFIETPIWTSLSEIEAFSSVKGNLELLDSLGGGDGNIDKLIKSNALISLQVTDKNSFDFTYFIDLSSKNSQQIATSILKAFQGRSDIRQTDRLYQGHKLSELTKGNKTFTYFIDDNVLVGSFTSFLVEDVVRLLENENKNNFKRNNTKLFDMPKLANDDGNIYINIKSFAQFISLFKKPESRNALKNLQNFATSAFLDLSINEDKVLFNGFTLNSNNQFLNTFQQQGAVTSEIKYFIPNQTSTFCHYLFTDAASWHEAIKVYWKNNTAEFFSKREKFEKEYNFDFDGFYSWIDSDIAIATLESVSDYNPDKLVYIKAKDANEALNQLNTFSEALAKANGDTVYIESFSDYQIRELQVKEFPEYAFGELYKGYDECYYTLIDDYIIMANTMQAMKGLIADIENEGTWGRSVIFNKFLESNLDEANVTFIFNSLRGYNKLLSGMDAKWKDFAKKYSSQFKGFNLGSIQFSKLDDSFYTSFALKYEKQQYVTQERQHFKSVFNTKISDRIITKPYVTRSHIDNSLETVIQDSAYNVSLISSKGDILWSDSLNEPIISDIEQIDFYKNGKLQYFFATPNGLHIIDRLGNYVDGYPVSIENANILYASVVDYDKSKKYRFLLGDERGNLYLYNKNGVVLEGWTPRSISGRLACKPFHVRVRGRDCIVAIQQDGIINIMNRRGEMIDGFPLDLNERINTEPFVYIGSDFEKTEFTLLSREGKIIKFNLNGTVLRTEQLYKPAKETIFQLVPDALNKTYLIVRQDRNRLVLLNSDKEEILAKDYLSTGKLLVQCYNFSADNKIFAITDGIQGFGYIYDKDGKLINSTPIDSEHEIAIIYFDSTKRYNLYCIANNEFKVLTF